MAEPLIDLVIESLSRAAVATPGDHPQARAFVHWMIGSDKEASLEPHILPAEPLTAPTVAALGYASAALRSNPSIRQRFVEGINWLRGRQFFVGHRPRGFEVDGVALLGAALGIASLREDVDCEVAIHWIRALLARAVAEASQESWHGALIRAAQFVLGDVEAVATMPSDLKAALASKGLLDRSGVDEPDAIETIVSLNHRKDGSTRAATQLRALKYLLRTRATLKIVDPTIGQVVQLLDRIGHSMKRWAWDERARSRSGRIATWDILHEYHVQGLLWVVLAPLFPDLEDEENLPSLGQKHPRADLGIPSLGLVIEVKFVRSGTSSEFAKIIGEVAEDASLYLSSESGYSKIVAFVWDDSAHGEQHTELRQGLQKIGGVEGAVVLSRPGKMRQTTVDKMAPATLKADPKVPRTKRVKGPEPGTDRRR
jgi:hypothetical protein